jgi:lysophospholipase L1-like esterase
VDAAPLCRRLRSGLWAAARVTALSLLAAELFLRFLRPVEFRAPPAADFLAANDQLLYRRSAVPGLLYEMKPNAPRKIIAGSWVETNSHGMRDGEPLPDDASIWRIAVVGDSFVFGLGLPPDEVFTEVLERDLGRGAGDGRRFEVLNFGVPGYSSQEEAAVLEHKALAWKPRVVIVGYCLNDPETEPLQPLHVYFSPVAWWQHSHLLRLAALFSMTMKTDAHGDGDYVRFLHAAAGGKWPTAERAFARMHELTAARGVPALLVIFPLLESPSWSEYPYRDLHAQVAEAARARGLEVLDLLPVFEREPPASLWVFPEDHHPSRLGNRLAADAIRQRLAELGWLD